MLLNGVRKAAIATAGASGEREMERTMAVSLRESVQLVSDPRNLDASVEEVFELMLGLASWPLLVAALIVGLTLVILVVMLVVFRQAVISDEP